MNNALTTLLSKIADYRRKYYLNMLIKGLLIGTALILSAFLFVNFLEYFGRFGTLFRIVLLVLFLGILAYTLVQFILKPIFHLYHLNKPLTDTEAALQIGQFFPNIKDKLINTLQLAQLSSEESSLIQASISQKTEELKLIKFADAVNLNENKKYIKYALPPLLLILLLSSFVPKFFNSTERIVKFNKTFAEPAPFEFEILNQKLEAIKNEDYTLKLKLNGVSLPDNVYLVSNSRKHKMQIIDSQGFDYTFTNVQESIDFHFEAAGYSSNSFKIKLIARPNLLSFNVRLKYPSYLNKRDEEFENVGNLIIPEGTQVQWKFKTVDTDQFKMVFDSLAPINVDKGLFSDYHYEKKILRNTAYQIQLLNKQTPNANPIHYLINIVPDKYPLINFDQLIDSSLYNYIGLGGNIADDYGITDFKFMYRIKGQKDFTSIPIPFDKNLLSQNYFYQVDINTLGLKKADQLEYYLQVTDNDAINGRKSTKTSTLNFNMPSNTEFSKEVENEVNKTEDKFEDILKKSKEFKKELSQLENELKKKKELDFQDKKDLDRLIQKKDDINKEIQNLKEQLQQLLDKQNRFDSQPNPKTQEKMEMLQKMLDDLMQNPDSKVLEELKKLMEKSLDEKSLEQLDKFNKNQRNLDRDLDRTLNLFKDLQRKQKIEETVKELRDLAEKQDQLSDKALEEKQNSEELQKQQEDLSNKFKEQSEKIEKIDEQSDELKKPFDSQEQEQNDVKSEQQNAQKNLKQQKNSDAAKAQKNAAKKMKKMADSMEQQMQSAEMQQTQMDFNALRAILENLITVSHSQENLMKTFRNISVSDPRFVQLSQEQLNLANDVKIIEDSLYTLASRVMQIEALVTKEVTSMKNNIDESLQFIKDRKLPNAAAKQQFTMTSMNNLALMLSDIFKQMQQQMSPGSGSGGKGKGGTLPGEFGQKQKMINDRIQGIGSGQKSSKEISEEIAKLANEQAKLRRELQELQDQLNGTEAGKKLGNELKDLQKDMEKSEEDLVNKRINPELRKRQKEIETRLLEADKAIKEQELDPTRKSRTASQKNRVSPPELEKFRKEKQKQVELLRTTPPNFTPFFKKQTEDYFRRIN